MHRSHLDRRQPLRLMASTAGTATLPSLPGTSLAQTIATQEMIGVLGASAP